MEKSFSDFLARHANSEQALAIVEAEKKEIYLYKKYKNYFTYGVYVAKKLAIQNRQENRVFPGKQEIFCLCYKKQSNNLPFSALKPNQFLGEMTVIALAISLSITYFIPPSSLL